MIQTLQNLPAIVLFAYLLVIPSLVNSAETVDATPMDIMQNMAKTIANAPQLSVKLHSRYDALQENGQIIEFEAIRTIQLTRPGKMRVDLRQSDGDQHILTFDGQQITYYNVIENVYTLAEKVGTVDDAIKYLVGTLNIPLPVARLFRTTLPSELEQLVEDADYVELNRLTDETTDHIAAKSKDVDFQLWITQGKRPLPKRIVITYKNAPGEPQFRADFSDWDISKTAIKGSLSYLIPKDAEQVPLVARQSPKVDTKSLKGDAP